MINETEVELLAVRIEIKKCEEWDVIGSGVLWIPEVESEYIYIFTAGHVVKDYIDSEYDIYISYYDKEQIVRSEVINKDDIRVHANYKDNEDSEFKDCDAAVLRSKNIICNRIIYNINLHENKKRNENLIFNGFPDCLKTQEFEIHINQFYGSYRKHMKQKREFIYKLDIENSIDPSIKNEELVGVSGSGIFISDNGYFHLIGVHTGGLGKNANFNNVVGVGIKYFIDICEDNFYDVPKLSSEIDGKLLESFNDFMRDIKNKEIIYTMRSIIMNDFSEIIKLGFCDQSQKCEHSDFYHRCKTFRFHLLVVITLIRYFNSNIEISEFMRKVTDLKLKFICSDGANGDNPPITIMSFIRSLNEDYLDRKHIEEESLVIWGSKNSVRGNLEVLEDEYINNVQDIYLMKNDSRFDILLGRGKPNKLRIMHIDEVIRYINLGNIEHFKKYIEF